MSNPTFKFPENELDWRLSLKTAHDIGASKHVRQTAKMLHATLKRYCVLEQEMEKALSYIAHVRSQEKENFKRLVDFVDELIELEELVTDSQRKEWESLKFGAINELNTDMLMRQVENFLASQEEHP